MNLTPKRKIQISIVMFVFIFVLSLFFVFRPLVVKIKNKSESLSAQKTSLLFLEKQIKNVQEFQKQFSTDKGGLNNLNSSFLNYFAPVEFFEFLEEVASNTGVFLDASPLPEKQQKEETKIKTMIFEVLIAGDFSDCLRFLKQIEKGPFLSQTTRISIEKLNKNTERYKQFQGLVPGQVVFTINLEVLAKEKNVE